MRFVDYRDIVNWSPRHLKGAAIHYRPEYSLARLGDILVRSKDTVKILPDVEYSRLTLRKNYGGILLRDRKLGQDIGRKKQYRVKGGQLLVSKIDISQGAVGIIPKDLSEAVVTENFWVYDSADPKNVKLEYLALVLTTSAFMSLAGENSNGTTGRQYMQEAIFLNQYIPLPDVSVQNSLVRKFDSIEKRCFKMKKEAQQKEHELYERLFDELGLNITHESLTKGQLHLFNSNELHEWSYEKLKTDAVWASTNYEDVRIGECPEFFLMVQRGINPQYTANAGTGLLNQKCVRWYNLDLIYMKNVTKESLTKYSRELFTKRGDLLVNSTGDGTIGRSAVVRQKNELGRLFDSHVLLLRVNKNIIDPEYLCLLFNSQYVQDQIERLKSAVATSQTELGVENLRKVRIILPPIEKQRTIARELSYMRKRIPGREAMDKLRKKARNDFEQAIISEE